MIQERAHPRSRGENAGTTVPPMVTVGSSPLTRGKHLGLRQHHQAGGLIPAHAGKTRSTLCSTTGRRAHPRSRGENGAVAWPCRNDSGSSPLTRGKRGPRGLGSGRRRLIPAHAGKTSPPPPRRPSTTAHPRSRGENPRPVRLWPSAEAHPRSRGENSAATSAVV